MTPTLLAQIDAATSLHVALSGDTLTWNGTAYPSVNTSPSTSQTMDEGGFREVVSMQSVVRHADMPSAPPIGARITAEGRSWRVANVGCDAVAWDFTLDSPTQ